MRRACILAWVAIVGAVLTAAAAAQQPPAMEPIGQIQKVRNNLFMIPGQGGNTAVFVTRTGVVLVDTKLTGNGQAILDRVAAVADVPVTTIINTHSHYDHVGSNEFFSPTVEVVTHENTRVNMARDPAVSATPHAMPDRTFRDKLTIGRGQDQVDLYYFGPGHTNGDAFVVFPSVRTMHGGDIFPWKGAPLTDAAAGGSALRLPDTLEAASKEIRNVDTVIPGHRPVTTWATFLEFTEFNRELVKAAQAAQRAGRTADQAAAELKLPPRFSAYLEERGIPGLEFLGTGISRARDNVRAVYEESRQTTAPR